jgi:hypothetical protein
MYGNAEVSLKTLNEKRNAVNFFKVTVFVSIYLIYGSTPLWTLAAFSVS